MKKFDNDEEIQNVVLEGLDYFVEDEVLSLFRDGIEELESYSDGDDWYYGEAPDDIEATKSTISNAFHKFADAGSEEDFVYGLESPFYPIRRMALATIVLLHSRQGIEQVRRMASHDDDIRIRQVAQKYVKDLA